MARIPARLSEHLEKQIHRHVRISYIFDSPQRFCKAHTFLTQVLTKQPSDIDLLASRCGIPTLYQIILADSSTVCTSVSAMSSWQNTQQPLSPGPDPADGHLSNGPQQSRLDKWSDKHDMWRSRNYDPYNMNPLSEPAGSERSASTWQRVKGRLNKGNRNKDTRMDVSGLPNDPLEMDSDEERYLGTFFLRNPFADTFS